MSDFDINKGLLKRSFTIRNDVDPTELLILKIDYLERMRIEFIQAFNDLFESGYRRLEKQLKIKFAA